MTTDEINKEWERDVFGDGEKSENANYQKLVNDFLSNRAKKAEHKKSVPPNVSSALKIFGLTDDDGWAAIQKKYRALAKQEHPDSNKSKDQGGFIKIGNAYQILKKYFKK